MKRHLLYVCAFAAATVCLLATGAHAATPGPTDGTQCTGQYCPGTPPPTAPFFAQGHDCQLDVIDPPSYVFVTEHFVYGTTPPAAGVVPVVDDASAVFPYVGSAPGLFTVNIETYVAGKQGFRADTWNIGKGVTTWVPFNCTTPDTTSTTTTTERPQCLIPEGCTTTTTTAPVATTVPHAGRPSTTLQLGTAISTSSGTPTLPMTGGAPWPLATLGACAVGAGTAMVRNARRSNR